ncbi:glycosyltransferase [Fulvimarina sp. MAC8]|uniref:glycosyltransferase n=1 Tax=Fulvimarina sp. MAC8 TaxID=3162874 RepID=UPI0032EF029C
MKIIHLMIDGGLGGAETFLLRLANALQRRGHPQLVVLTPKAEHEAYLAEHGIPFRTMRFDTISKLLTLPRLRYLFMREKPDAAVAWMNRAGRNLPGGRHLTVGRIGNPYNLKNFRRCDMVIANSPDLVEHAVKANRPDARMIANFIDLPEFRPVDRSAITRPLLFASGRLNPIKGFDVLIRSLKAVDAHLWIAGVGPELSSLQDLARTEGVADRVEFLGWRRDIPALLAASDIFVLPSRGEGTSNSLLEAAAAGKPIVTTDGRSVSWFLTDDVDSLIVPVNDVAALSDAVGRLVSNRSDAERIGSAAQRLYQELFSEDAICDQWLTALREGITEKTGRSPT